MGGYSTQEVSDLIGLKPDQVRHYVRRDLLDPVRGERAVAGLEEAGLEAPVLVALALYMVDREK